MTTKGLMTRFWNKYAAYGSGDGGDGDDRRPAKQFPLDSFSFLYSRGAFLTYFLMLMMGYFVLDGSVNEERFIQIMGETAVRNYAHHFWGSFFDEESPIHEAMESLQEHSSAKKLLQGSGWREDVRFDRLVRDLRNNWYASQSSINGTLFGGQSYTADPVTGQQLLLDRAAAFINGLARNYDNWGNRSVHSMVNRVVQQISNGSGQMIPYYRSPRRVRRADTDEDD